MPQSLIRAPFHLVFSTKNRHPYLSDPTIRQEMHAFLGGTSKTLGCTPVIVGGMEDHVHILAHLTTTLSVADWIKELKRASSVWVKQRSPSLATFSWQQGYGAFANNISVVPTILTYIQNQETHHATVTFQDEMREFLRRHQITCDERYLWD